MQIEFRLIDHEKSGLEREPQPVRFARMRAVITMPSMPVMPKFDEIPHPEFVAGDYGVHPTFPHGGEYLLTLTLMPPDGGSSLNFTFPLSVGDMSQHSVSERLKPFSMQVQAPPLGARAGVPFDLAFTIRRETVMRLMPDGGRLKENVAEFDWMHEKLLHLFIVSENLGEFAHEHPSLDRDGVFRLRYTFPTGGTYHLFADVAPKGAGAQTVFTKLTVAGPTVARFDFDSAPRGLTREVGDLRIAWTVPDGKLRARRTESVRVQWSDESGKRVTDLEPWLGAMAHLVMVHQDGETFAHSHPDEREQNQDFQGTLNFLVRLPKPGLYRAWLQFQRGGEIQTADFVLEATQI